MEYLSQEEQFKETLNNEEISQIKDHELRELRMKYWNQRHSAFLDEYGIKDQEFGSVWNKIYVVDYPACIKLKWLGSLLTRAMGEWRMSVLF